VDELPGTHVSTSKLHEEWVQIRKNIARDKSKSREDLEGCRMMLKSIYQRGAEAAAAKPPTPEPQGAKEGEGDGEGEAADAAADGGEDGGEAGAEGGEGGREEGEESDEAKLDAAKEAQGNERAQRDAADSKSEPELLPGGVTRLELLGVAGEYARCISSLREKREKALLPLALGEYGQVLRLLGNLKGATRAWGDAIDSVFTVMQVGKNWRTIVPRSLMLRGDSTPSGEHLISQFGAWGVLTAATISTTLARYGHVTDLHQQLELSLLAAHLFAVPFSSGLPHPQRAAEFAGYSPRELVAGFEPSSDTMRFEPASVMDAVEFAAPILLRNGLAVETLPMLTLYQVTIRPLFNTSGKPSPPLFMVETRNEIHHSSCKCHARHKLCHCWASNRARIAPLFTKEKSKLATDARPRFVVPRQGGRQGLGSIRKRLHPQGAGMCRRGLCVRGNGPFGGCIRRARLARRGSDGQASQRGRRTRPEEGGVL
jgi:hypothetical protein